MALDTIPSLILTVLLPKFKTKRMKKTCKTFFFNFHIGSHRLNLLSGSSEQLFSDVAGNPILEIEGNDPFIFKAGYFTSGLGLNLINNLTVVWTTGNPIWKNIRYYNGPYYAKSTNTFYFRYNLFSRLEYQA